MGLRIAILGLGDYGSELAKQLVEMRAELIAVDKHVAHVQAIPPYVNKAVVADITRLSVDNMRTKYKVDVIARRPADQASGFKGITGEQVLAANDELLLVGTRESGVSTCERSSKAKNASPRFTTNTKELPHEPTQSA